MDRLIRTRVPALPLQLQRPALMTGGRRTMTMTMTIMMMTVVVVVVHVHSLVCPCPCSCNGRR
jgi:hypothetical protein